MAYLIYYNLYISHIRTKKTYVRNSKLLNPRWLYVSVEVLGQSPSHNMCLLQYTYYIEYHYYMLIVITHIILNTISDSDSDYLGT